MIKFPEDQYVEVNGLKIRYWQVGERGEKLLLVHGIGGCVEYWHKNVFELGKKYQVIVVDLPGFGKSDKPKADYTLDYYSDFLAAFCKAKAWQDIILLGHSLGGGVSLRFAIKHRPLLKKLVLIDAVGFSRQVIIFFRLMALPVIGRLFLKLSKKMFAIAFRSNVYDASAISNDLIDVVYPLTQDPKTIDTMRRIVKRNTNLLGIKHSMLKLIWDHLAELEDLPTLVFWGMQDRLLLTKRHVPEVKAKLPSAQLHLLDKCGHIPYTEHPKEFREVLTGFVDLGSTKGYTKCNIM